MQEDEVMQDTEVKIVFVVGYKDHKVVLQSQGKVPQYFTWDPSEARTIAALLLAAADEATEEE